MGFNYNENNITEGRKTVISPSLIFLIRSPVTIEVIDPNNNHYFEEDGITFIEDTLSGNCQLLVKGKEKRKYQIIVGQIAQNNDLLEKIKGSITANQPEKEINVYQFSFSSNFATPQFPTPSPTNPSSNNSNQSQQSSDSNTSNQSSTQTNPSLTPTPTEKILSINRLIPKNLIKPSKN